MTLFFKDLKKFVVDTQQQQLQQQQQRHDAFSIFHGKEFWIWDIEEHKRAYSKTHGHCCFNHIIGLPQKNGIDNPLYDYEKIIYDSLIMMDDKNNNKHLWSKRALGTMHYLEVKCVL